MLSVSAIAHVTLSGQPLLWYLSLNENASQLRMFSSVHSHKRYILTGDDHEDAVIAHLPAPYVQPGKGPPRPCLVARFERYIQFRQSQCYSRLE